MNLNLEVELLQYPFRKASSSHQNRRQNNNFSQSQGSHSKLHMVKVISMSILVGVFLICRLFFQQKQNNCIFDLSHQWTTSINRLLNENELFYQTLIIIAQQSIQINIICLCLISTWKVNNLKVHLFMAIFYGLRGILLNIERFPYPPNIRWEAPWLPSLTVPYGITRDYFYSGHTGLMLFSTFWCKHLGFNTFYQINIVLTPIVILTLLSTRVHYSIDIIAACIFTFWLEKEALKKVYLFDKFWSLIYLAVEEIIKYLRNALS